MNYLFYNCNLPEEVDLSGFRMDEVTSATSMFAQNPNVKYINVDGVYAPKLGWNFLTGILTSNTEKLDFSKNDTPMSYSYTYSSSGGSTNVYGNYPKLKELLIPNATLALGLGPTGKIFNESPLEKISVGTLDPKYYSANYPQYTWPISNLCSGRQYLKEADLLLIPSDFEDIAKAEVEKLKNYRLGERGRHISYFFRDEVGNLIQHYNDMTDALAESTHRLARSEREGAWRTMARQVAHEINNPLTPMKLTLQQLQRHKGTERFDEYFDRSTQLLIEQIETLGHIAKSFSSFAKMPEVNPTQMDVAKKLYDFILLMRNNDAQIPIRYVGPEYGVDVIADAEQITQVFTNIVRNALQAMEGNSNGDIIIILKQVPDSQRIVKGLSEQEQWVEISFSDNGPGISDEVRDKVFIPNFTTKNTGAGLGLAISKNIVEGSGGKITFQTSEKGTTFFVYLKKK